MRLGSLETCVFEEAPQTVRGLVADVASLELAAEEVDHLCDEGIAYAVADNGPATRSQHPRVSDIAMMTMNWAIAITASAASSVAPGLVVIT